jgi:ribosomal protein L13E
MMHLLGKKPIVRATIKSSTVGVNRNRKQGSGFRLQENKRSAKERGMSS